MNNVGLIQSLSAAGKIAGYAKAPRGEFALPYSDNYITEAEKERRYQLYLNNRERALKEAEAREERLRLAKRKAHEECEEEIQRLKNIGEQIQEEYEKTIFEKIYVTGGFIRSDFITVEKEKLYRITELEDFVECLKDNMMKQFNLPGFKYNYDFNELKDSNGNIIFDFVDTKIHKRKNLAMYTYQYINGTHIIKKKPSIDDKKTIHEFTKKKLMVVDIIQFMSQQDNIKIIDLSENELFTGSVYQLMWTTDGSDHYLHPLAKRYLNTIISQNNSIVIIID